MCASSALAAAVVGVVAIRLRARLPCRVVAVVVGLRARKLSLLRLTWLRQKPIPLALRGRQALLLATAAKAATAHSAAARSKSSATAAAAAVAGRLDLLQLAVAARD